MRDKELTWYFDFISPFAFLQWPEVRDLAKSHSVQIKPVLFAGLLQHWGHLGPAEIPSKRQFTYRHVQWLAGKLGVPLRFPPAHPFNPLKSLRLAVACECRPEAIHAIFDYLWVKGLGLDDPAFTDLCTQVGILDPENELRAESVKNQLRTNGAEAVSDGVFGVPTMVVDGILFWGLDATQMLRDYLANPSMMQQAEMQRVGHLPVGVMRHH